MSTAAADGIPRIAIVGMAGRFPGAPDVETFWQNLRAGRESITFFSGDELRQLGVDPVWLNNPSFVAARPQIDNREMFDAGFFGYSAQEAEIIDPQQRLFLEVGWSALEDAGYVPHDFDGLIGAYAGSSQNTYLWFNLLGRPGFFEQHGPVRTIITNGADYLAPRIAYKLNLRGPSLSVQTACSTSLVAVHLACQGLLNFECDVALAGGTSLRVTPIVGYLYESGGLMSRDGHCRVFDAKASGTLFGDGAGVVVLKRLEDAERDGDTIRAVILGSAVNNDGAHKAGFTAPASSGQAAVVFQAIESAGVSADSISYVEAHGTGTELGDPIEISALTKAFRASTTRRGFCALGSVKSNIGHLDAAAGVAGLIKTVLALQHRELPPSLHYETRNPNIDFDASPFFVNAALREWQSEGPRRAGVSAFGIGGTNANVVIEQPPVRTASGPGRPAQLLLISARGEKPLADAVAQLARACRTGPDRPLADVAYTLSLGRRPFPHRVAVVAHSLEEAAARLERRDPRSSAAAAPRATETPVVFLFPGQGAQYVQMARGLYTREPRLRARIDELSVALQAEVGWDLRTLLFPAVDADAATLEAATARLRQTEVTQPALFVIALALAEQWLAWGVTPRAMLGHSIGEYVAATLAGVFTWRDALRLVAARGRLMQQCAPGVMLAVPLGEAAVRSLLTECPDVEVAVLNTPASTVVAGPDAAIAHCEAVLAAAQVTGQRVATSHAFHSAMMEPAVAPFTAIVAAVPRSTPTRRWVSNLTGTWITPAEATDPAYWAQHLRQPVRFADGVATLLADGDAVVLEVGPGTTLGRFVRQHPAGAALIPRATLRAALDPADDLDALLLTLGQLWTAGVTIDWDAYWAGEQRHRIPLPTYPFDRQRYWLDAIVPGVPAPVAAAADPQPITPADAPHREISDWFTVPVWKQSTGWPMIVGSSSSPAEWLVVLDDAGFGSEIATTLRRAGQSVTTATRAATYGAIDANSFGLRLDEADDVNTLLAELRAAGRIPDRIVCCAAVRATLADAPATLERDSFFVPLALAQALATIATPVRMAIITSNAFEVIGGDGLLPEGALATGVTRVAPRELPHLVTRQIDLPLAATPTAAWPRLAALVIDEFEVADPAPVVAYRNGRRWIHDSEAVALDSAPATRLPFRDGGTYLVTGGAGGLGLSIASALAARYRANLVLVTRRGADPAVVRELESAGSRVLSLRADVADPQACATAIATARATFGRLDGVIHAAGLAGGGLIALKTPGAAASVLRPKVAGTRALLDALADHFPDVVVLFSSLASIVGDLGQVDYTAANAYLDATAQLQSAAGHRVVSINWDAWRDVGMAVATGLSLSIREERTKLVAAGIAPADGVEAFFRVLATPFVQVAVSSAGLAVRRREADSAALFIAAAATLRVGRHKRPDLVTPFVAPRTDDERRLAGIWEGLLGADGIGRDDNFFELGGDSLLATQLMARLRAAFNRECSLRQVMEHATIASLAGLVAEEVSTSSADSDAALLEELAAMTDEEAEARLQSILNARGPA
jgi:acyl transferase domain-containing protein/acyl carrier protein